MSRVQHVFCPQNKQMKIRQIKNLFNSITNEMLPSPRLCEQKLLDQAVVVSHHAPCFVVENNWGASVLKIWICLHVVCDIRANLDYVFHKSNWYCTVQWSVVFDSCSSRMSLIPAVQWVHSRSVQREWNAVIIHFMNYTVDFSALIYPQNICYLCLYFAQLNGKKNEKKTKVQWKKSQLY